MKNRLQLYATILIGLLVGCGDDEAVQTQDVQDATHTADVGVNDVSGVPDLSEDTGTPEFDQGPLPNDECDLDDNIPDDCYDVPALTRDNAQLSTRVQVNGKFWSCGASPNSFVFDVACFMDGSVAFPSGNWRNAIFDEGKVMSIKYPDPTPFTGEVDLHRDSPSWVGVGEGGAYDMSISRIPGDFSHNLPESCVVRNSPNPELDIENAAHATDHDSCWLEVTKTYYLNVRLIEGTCSNSGVAMFTQCSHTFSGLGAEAGW